MFHAGAIGSLLLVAGPDLVGGEGDLWPRLPEISMPTLILSGAQSPIAKDDEAKAMQQRMPAAKRVAFEGFGHGVNLLAPDRCVSEVRQFLAERKGATS